MKDRYPYIRKFLTLSLTLTFLVIAAGSWVRVSGAGMGCPDWPKCFGYYIPPTKSADLTWKKHYSFDRKQMILVKEKLFYANKDFKTGETFESQNWTPYEKKYAENTQFNVTKTWIEYINRLVSVILGISVAFSVLFCWLYGDNRLRILGALLLLLLGFQAWFGALVVYSELQPIKVSLHMLIALIIIALILWMLRKTYRDLPYPKEGLSLRTKKLSLWILLLLGVQIFLGTQSRQSIDESLQKFGSEVAFLKDLPLAFYLHRVSAVTFLILVIYLFYLLKKTSMVHIARYAMISTVATFLVGVIIFYFDFPYLSQTAHLLLSSVLFSLLFWIALCHPPKKYYLLTK